MTYIGFVERRISKVKLKELGMDMPYIKNENYIIKIQEREGLSYQEAVRQDYELNWKEKRWQFQLMTRCMTSMVERIMHPIETGDCWKILIECVDDKPEERIKNLLGVYTIQILFDVKKFFELSEYNKKKMVVETILKGINKLEEVVPFKLGEIREACDKIISEKYHNIWRWKKPIKLMNQYAQIEVVHEVNIVNIHMLFLDNAGNVIKNTLIISALPDEICYNEYLGKLERISDTQVALITKSGEKYIQEYN